jgi:hypothetical protein
VTRWFASFLPRAAQYRVTLYCVTLYRVTHHRVTHFLLARQVSFRYTFSDARQE